MIALLAAGFAPAQDRPPVPRTKIQQEQDQQRQASSADSLTPAQDQDPAEESYAGPSVLSRDKSLLAQRRGKLVDFRLYGEIMGVYDSGLTPLAAAAPSPAGNQVSDFGLESGVGVIGSRRWKTARLSLEYHGRYLHYRKNTLLNGSDQFLDLAYSRAIRRHWILDLKELAGTTTLANGEFTYLSLSNTDLFALPANDLFDVRTNYFESRTSVIWQKSERLSFDLGGEGFLVRRQSLALAGLDGYGARAGLAYRLTRRQTITAAYQHIYFDFQRAFGNAGVDTAGLGYAVALTRRLDFAMQIGGSRVDTLGLTRVTLDPAIAAVVGQNIAIVTFARTSYIPLLEARLTQRFRHSALLAGYISGITPGNGVYLTSRQRAATAGFTYAGLARFTLALSASYNDLSTLGQTLPNYTNLQGGGGLTYRLLADTYLELRYDYRHYTTQHLIFQKDSNRVSFGLAFSPGAAPLAIW
ncbi:MAG TPA: hypothetical protein VEV17_19940 [Bryobacteraceae bacterium]|nr:hypothetical protein [Bryobacteraceae bacterium]